MTKPDFLSGPFGSRIATSTQVSSPIGTLGSERQ